MKRLFSVLLTLLLCVGLLAGCTQGVENKSEKVAVYSFYGENEQFAVTNGVIVIGADEEIFYGGDLAIIDQEQFADIASYSVKFYTMVNGEERTIMHNSVVDQTGGSINVPGDLGRMSGENLLIGNKAETASELTDSLYFELSITDLSGKQKTFQLQLRVTEVTE